MSTDLTTILQAPNTLKELAKALPEHLNVQRFARIALTEVRKNPELAKCSAASFMGALVQSAQLGLEPGSGLGHAYLIPFFNKKTGEHECTFIPGYKGLLTLARRSGEIKRISAACVFEGDMFDYSLGSEEYIKHKPCGETRAAAVTHVYGVCEFKDGGLQMEVMTRQQIDAIKTRGRQNNVWNSDYTEMARKTVLRRLCKYLPLSPELADALRADGDAEADLALPDRPEPAKYKALMEQDGDDMAGARRLAERRHTEKQFMAAAESASAIGGDVIALCGISREGVSHSADADLDVATEKLISWITECKIAEDHLK